MGQLIARQASAFDFLQVQDLSGRALVRHRRFFGLLARQVAESEAMTLTTQAGELVLVCGLHEDPDHPGAEAWFAVGPALKGHLRHALGMVAQSLEVIGGLVPGLVVTAYIDPRSVAGDRLAHMLGFDPAGETVSDVGPLKTWRRVL